MSTPLLPDDQKVAQLKVQIEHVLDDTWRKYQRYNRFDVSLILLSVALSGIITILGFLGQGTWAGMLGVILTSLLSIQKVFNLAEKSNYYRSLHMQTKQVRDRLTYKVVNEEDLQGVVDAFIALRNERIGANPRRKGWEETGKLASELSK